MSDEELDKFIQKFMQLREDGLTAHLDLDNHAGQAWIGIRVMLNPFKHSRENQRESKRKSKYRSPSYFRRQERRKAAKSQYAAEVSQFQEGTARSTRDRN